MSVIFFFVIKNKKNSENTRFREQEPFLKNAKMVFGVMLSKTVLDVFQNKPINLGFSLEGGIMNELKCNNIYS